MRLHLTVQRHGIPPVRVLWSISPTRPPLAAAGSSITISQFLEQVNDVIPIESVDWGLEDYAVEVHGFECLHFSELGQILKEDDEVYIRPLQTTDLRVRRVSGRHQISADGKHLVDGVAFGRAFLRKADRPPIKIPPRKRRRLTYDEEENVEDGEELNDRQLVLRAGSNEEGRSVGEDESDNDDDFLPNDDDEADLGAELADLRDELQAGGNDDGGVASKKGVEKGPRLSIRKSRRSPKGLGLLQLLDENGQPFVGQYHNPLLDVYGQDEAPPTHSAMKKRKRRSPKLLQGGARSAKFGVQDSSASPERVSRRGSAGSSKSVHFDDAEQATPATILESEDLDEANDDNYDPDMLDESDKENAEPVAEVVGSSEEETSDSSSTSASEESDSDETSSSGSSSTDSDSDLEPEEPSTRNPDQKSESSGTSSSDSSSSSSESESEPEPEPKRKTRKMKKPVDRTQSHILNTLENTKASIVEHPGVKTVPPGKGMQKTIARNRRRKRQKTFAYLKSHGLLASEDNVRLDSERRQHECADAGTSEELPEQNNNKPSETLNAKREALLTSIANGGIDIKSVSYADGRNDDSARNGQAAEGQAEDIEMTEPAEPPQEDNRAPDVEMIDVDRSPAEAELVPNIAAPSQESRAHATASNNVDEPPKGNLASETNTDKTPASMPDLTLSQIPSPSSQHRRSKLDLSGAKRMLFGSLGLKTPKTKQDESRTREKLMKDVRLVKEPQLNPVPENLEDVAADESWKDKIDLRAVECCQKGVQLSTPPFPFVQRWDPQQQRGYNNSNSRKRKGKKRKRNNNDYYEGNSSQGSQLKTARTEGYEAPEDDSELPHSNKHAVSQQEIAHEESLQDSQAVSEQLLRETGEASGEGAGESISDLPSLPEDPTTCPSLTREAAKEGTVIAFKQLEMSAETNWQPNISEYRTAVVDQVMTNGTLQMTPAKRDRPRKQVDYDDQTGERLYSKFEMPGFNDEADDDKLEISFDELISPILVRALDERSGQNNRQDTRLDGSSTKSGISGTPIDGLEVIHQPPVNDSDATDGAKEDNTVGLNEEDREEISDLIRDAGWRSSIQPDLNCDLFPREDQREDPTLTNEDGPEDTTLVDAPSPRLYGSSSSPFVNVRSSPPPGIAQSPKRFHASGIEIADSVPPQDISDFEAQSAISESRFAIQYPSLPHTGDDSELLQDEAQHRSDPPFADQIHSQDITSLGMEPSPAQSTRSRSNFSQEISPPPRPIKSHDGVESEDEFPEPFSQAWESRMSQELDIKPELSQENFVSPPSYRNSKVIGRRASSQRESNLTWRPDGDWSAFADDDEDDGGSTPRPSQQQKSSQVVDLTISSDAMDLIDSPHDSGENSYKLPRGPGWVKKTKTSSRKRSVSTQASSVKAKIKSR